MKLMKIKYMVVGIVIGVLATAALTAGASTVYEKFTAVARPDYTLVVDGEKVALNTPPKTIEGATHLPLREMATILGKDVNFKSGTITLTTIEESEGDKVTTPAAEPKKSTEQELNDNEWISIRELAQSIDNKLLLTSEDGKQILFTEDKSIRIEFVADSSDEFIGYTGDGKELRFKTSKGSTYINIADLKSVGVID